MKENVPMGKQDMDIMGNISKRLSGVEDAIATFRKSLEAKANPVPEGADAKVNLIVDIIWQEISGSKKDDVSATYALTRGVRKALNEFYTQRRKDRSDTAFTADQTELNSCRQRISDLEVQLHSSVEIEKAARLEHARISEELVAKERDYHDLIIRSDGQDATILQLQRQLEEKQTMIDNVKAALGFFKIEYEITRTDGEFNVTEADFIAEQDDGPNYASVD
jgi:hypothetical protein